MLTKRIEKWSAENKRSSRIIMSSEAQALREMRIGQKLSMRKAGALIGVSDSYISHIENGRADVPKGPALDRFLTVYGGIKQKSFYERARNFREHTTPAEELTALIPRISTEKVKLLLSLAKTL